MKILAVSICNKFWRRLLAVAPSWNESASAFDGDLRFAVGTIDPEPEVGDNHLFRAGTIKIHKLNTSDHLIDMVPSKPSMLRELLKRESDQSFTHILFTDCDILHPATFGPWSLDKNALYQIAERVDLDAMQTAAFMSTGSFPDLSGMDTNPKKPGMGWFQLVRKEMFAYVTRGYRWDHIGYDVFDWELNRDLSKASAPVMISSPPFAHLWHGEPGSTWKGVQEDC